ncbi:MAG: hypothetical protein IMZ40_00760 [Bacilli bacterium]|nr:hypothetical protein [Bacilli bacterium]
MSNQLNDKQISVLRSLHFWRRNLEIASRHQDAPESNKSRDAISYTFGYCDRLNIPFKVQNQVIYAAAEDIAFSDQILLTC